MEDLGVTGRENPLADMNDERWNTPIGKEIWENVMMDKLYLAEHPSITYEEGVGVLEEDNVP
jgi:hypothetical protein